MKQKHIWGHTTFAVFAAVLAVLLGARGVRAEEAEVTEINGSTQLIRELSQNWEDDYSADDAAGSYQTKQLIVFADELTDYCGAVNVLHYEDIGTYYLQYDTEEDTRNAYRQLKKRYGKNCMLDEIVKAEDWQLSGGASWGSDYTGLDRLKITSPVSGLGGTVTVAVVDTGLNTQHYLFSGRRISSASRNLVDNTANISDVSGHGTHVAGIVADCTPAQVELMAVRVFDDQGLSSEAMLQAGILYAIQKGADVINLSLGDTNHVSNDNWLEPCIKAAWEKGIPVVCAAGNSKKNVSTCYPACDERTIAVSAIDKTGSFAKNFNSAEGSNYGSGIDFAAPGVSINSASIRNNYELESRSGTSMSAPFVAAAAAYIKLALPQSTVNQVKSILKSYAVDYGTPGKDDYYGYGVIRMDSLQIGLSGNVKLTVQNPSMVFSGKPCCPGVLVSGISSGQYTVSYANNTHPGTATVTVTGNGVYTGTVSTTFHITLGTPVVSSVDCTAKGIQIRWNSLAGADSYMVYRKKNNGSWSRIKTADGSATSYTDTGVSSGNTYQYRIRATGSGVTSNYSAAKQTVFVKAASLTGLANGDNGVTLKWKKVSGVSGYYIYRKSATQTSWQFLKQISSGSTTSCTDTKAAQGQQYTYQVRPYRKVSGQKYKGGAANTKTIVCMKKMAAPTLKNVSTKSMQVFWKTAAGADGYQIRWSLKKSMSSAKSLKVTGAKQQTAVISGLKKNKTYYVQIRSMKRTGKSTVYGNWSTKKSVRVRK